MARDGARVPARELSSPALNLPSAIRACLFDLDGVLTDTASLHAAAWKEMFDSFLRARAAREGAQFIPFDPARDYRDFIDGKQRSDGVRSFLASRGIALPEGSPGDPADADTVSSLGDRKNELVLAMIHSRGVQAYDGSVRFVRAVREAGLRRAVVSASANCRQVLEAAGIADLFEAVVDGVVAEHEHLRGKPAPDMFLAAATGPRRRAGRGGGVRGRARRRRRGTGGRVRPRRRRRPRRPGRRAARAWRRHRRHRSGRAAEPRVIKHPNFVVEPWSVRETALDLAALAQAESLFALSNGHLGLRANLDEGEPFGLPGTYLNSFYELRPLPYAEAGYGYPESGQTIVNVTNGKIIRLLVDDEPLDVRYGQLLAHERELDLRAGVLRRRLEWRSPAGTAVRVCSTRLVSFVQRSAGGDPLRGRAARRAAARGRAVRSRGQRARACALGRSARRRRPGGAAARRGVLRP